jgi:hypothetical protein
VVEIGQGQPPAPGQDPEHDLAQRDRETVQQPFRGVSQNPPEGLEQKFQQEVDGLAFDLNVILHQTMRPGG